MSNKLPRGAGADYFQVEYECGALCGHPHRSAESAARCLEDGGGIGVVAMKKRRDAIGSVKMHNQDCVSLTESELQSLIDWKMRADL